jgi:uncharacterized protein (DUF433 family)
MNDEWITSDPKILMGKPCVKGTRVSVELILEKIGAGEPIDQIVAAHPRLTREGVLAAVHYALAVLRSDIVLPVAAEVA